MGTSVSTASVWEEVFMDSGHGNGNGKFLGLLSHNQGLGMACSTQRLWRVCHRYIPTSQMDENIDCLYNSIQGFGHAAGHLPSHHSFHPLFQLRRLFSLGPNPGLMVPINFPCLAAYK